MTGKLLVYGSAYSNRDRVNVILPMAGNRDGNHHFPRARGDVAEYIRQAVTDLVTDARADGVRLWPAHPDFRVVVNVQPGRGRYTYSVYSTTDPVAEGRKQVAATLAIMAEHPTPAADSPAGTWLRRIADGGGDNGTAAQAIIDRS